jgi:TetR/AcrR family transcriptional regulator of autoinduction and epiphytic fitness
MDNCPCPHPELAAHQFLGLIQGIHHLAEGHGDRPAIQDMPPDKVIIDEAIRMFLGRYGVGQA